MRVQNRPEGLGGKMHLLGGAAPLSSRKIGYLLRVAHMIPIIFFPWKLSGGTPPGTRSQWLRFPRHSHKSMGTIIIKAKNLLN